MGEVKFMSNWEGVESVPESFVCPPEKRPGIPVKKAIPVIDLATDDRTRLVQKFLDASQEFGFFQVINHGVSKWLIEEAMRILKEFHSMSAEDKERECSKDPNKSCRLITRSETYMQEQAHAWRDSLIFNCYPLDKYVHFWPQNPSKYRDVVGAYCEAMRKLTLELLEMISEGLGVEKGELVGEVTENPMLVVNMYPPCPNPNLTFGIGQHTDPTLISILFQDVNGLQYLKDGEWVAVDPLDDALLVHIGYALQVVSNGKLKAVEHRVVTNTKTSRQSITYLVDPKGDVTIEPIKCLINNEANPPHYRSIMFKELREKYVAVTGDREAMMKFLTSDMS